jgi:RNA polymerase sigma factor (sigma-70 family)
MDGPATRTLEALLAEREWVKGLARVLAGNGADADDLEQEAWVAALRSPPSRPGPVRGWLATVLRRRRLDARRAEWRRLAREEAAARPEAVPSAEESVARAEVLRRVIEEVMALEEPGRTTVILRFFDGLAPGEIANLTGVPVETVRTRLRRALDVLRGRLDGKVDWRPWILLASAAVVLAAAGVFAFQPSGEVVVPHEPGVSPAPVAAVVPSDPEPVVPPVAAPLPARPATPAAGLLRLHVRIEPANPRFKERLALVATYENAGTGPILLYLPRHFSWTPFPEWRLRAPDGRVYAPCPGPEGQSVYQEGVQGEIVRLAPGESRSDRRFFSDLVPVEDPEREEGIPIRPGTYVVDCRLVRADDLVPWSEAFGRPAVQRAVEGLWTGTVEAEPFELRVLPGEEPAVTLAAPGPLLPGKPCLLEIGIENTATTPFEFRGRLLLMTIQKGRGPLDEASLVPGEPCTEAGKGEVIDLRVEPESTLRLPVDLSRLSGDWLDRRGLWLLARLEPQGEGRAPIDSKSLTPRVEPLPDVGGTGLRLVAEPKGGGVLAVTLRNDGRERVRVPRGFAWPARLRVSVRLPSGEFFDAVGDGGRTRHSSRDYVWDEAGAPRALSAADFADLDPGGVMETTVDLAGEGRLRFPGGTYEVAVAWRNTEGGIRGGLEPGSVLVGTLSSPAVRVDLPAR